MAGAQPAHDMFAATIKQLKVLAEELGLTYHCVGSKFELSDGYTG
jgi:hypothetical protein